MSSKILKWREFTEEEASKVKGHDGKTAVDLIKVGDKEWVLTKKWLQINEKIKNMEIKDDDTWVITFPRSGTTLTQELVWLVSNGFDFEAARKIPLLKRFPFLEHCILQKPIESADETMRNKLEEMIVPLNIENIFNQPSPRFIKTHLGLELLPHVLNSRCKIIYVARNPKDAIVSWYHFSKSFGKPFDGDLEDSWREMRDNSRIYMPYWAHIKEAWAERHRPNFLFLFYENIVADFPKAIKTIGDFLGKPYSDEQIDKLTKHLNIENFRTSESINPKELRDAGLLPKCYIRKGVVGDSKGLFSPEVEAEIDQWIRENLKDTDLVFPV